MNDILAKEKTDDTAKIFLSYSRKDRVRAQSIADVLRERHFGVFKDTDDILPTEEWRSRLEQLIAEADTVVFLLSPHSLDSEVCAWEVEYARSLGKRIAPIVITEVETSDIPADLARLNFIFCTERDRFQDAVDSLVSALSIDIDWIREHTRLADSARRWESAQRPRRLLLRGQEIANAESWRDSRPQEAPHVTPLQAQFIAASRKAATRRQQITVISSIIGLIFALGLAGFAYLQREAALENEAIAHANEKRAFLEQARAEKQLDAAQVNQSLFLTGFAEEQLIDKFPVEATLLALEAMPDERSKEPLIAERPLVDEAQVMLRKAYGDVHEDEVLLSGLSQNNRFGIASNGRWLALFSSPFAPKTKTLHIVDLTKEIPSRVIEIDENIGTPETINFNPDGSQFAFQSANGEVLIASTNIETPMKRLSIGEDFNIDVRFLNGGRELVVLDSSNNIFVVDLQTEKTVLRLTGSKIATTVNGDRLAVFNESRVVIYDAKTKLQTGISDEIEEERDAVLAMKFSNKGEWIAVKTDNQSHIFDGKTASFHGKTGKSDFSITEFGFDPSGVFHYILSGSGRTIVYNVAERTLVFQHEGPRKAVRSSALSPDQNIILTGDIDGNILGWSPSKSEPLFYFRGHLSDVTQLSFIEDGRKVISLSDDGTLRKWSIPSSLSSPIEKDAKTLIDRYAGQAVYTPDRTLMAVSDTGLFNVRTGEQTVLEERAGLKASFLRFSDDGKWLLAMMEKVHSDINVDACIFETATGKINRCIFNRTEGKIWDVDMDGDARLITFQVIDEDSLDRHFVSIDGRTGEEIARKVEPYTTRLSSAVIGSNANRLFMKEGHKIVVFEPSMNQVSTFGPEKDGSSVLFSPDRRRVAFMWSAAGDVEIWDTMDEKRLSRFKIPHMSENATVFSRSGKYITGMLKSSTELGVYESITGSLVSTLQIKETGYIGKPVFSDDETLIAASMNSTIAIAELKTGRSITQLKLDFRGHSPSIFGKAFIDKNDAFIAWTWDGPTKFPLFINTQKFVETVQRTTPRCLRQSVRKRFHLPQNPPRWCITGPGLEQAEPHEWSPKYPYDTTAWREWLIALDDGRETALPEK